MAVVGQGSRVRIAYRLTLEDGTLFEEADAAAPLEVTIGQGDLIPGLEAVLLGLSPGDGRQVRLEPAEAYGYASTQLTRMVPRAEFPAGLEPEPGLIVEFATPSGEQVPGTVVAVAADQVEVDFNHPLAGRVVVFEVEVLAVDA